MIGVHISWTPLTFWDLSAICLLKRFYVGSVMKDGFLGGSWDCEGKELAVGL